MIHKCSKCQKIGQIPAAAAEAAKTAGIPGLPAGALALAFESAEQPSVQVPGPDSVMANFLDSTHADANLNITKLFFNVLIKDAKNIHNCIYDYKSFVSKLVLFCIKYNCKYFTQ